MCEHSNNTITHVQVRAATGKETASFALNGPQMSLHDACDRSRKPTFKKNEHLGARETIPFVSNCAATPDEMKNVKLFRRK